MPELYPLRSHVLAIGSLRGSLFRDTERDLLQHRGIRPRSPMEIGCDGATRGRARRLTHGTPRHHAKGHPPTFLRPKALFRIHHVNQYARLPLLFRVKIVVSP